MRKLIPILIVSILVLSGLGAVAGSVEKTNFKKINLAFSEPEINEQTEYAKITIDETDSFLLKQNEPMLPSYTETFKFPFGTEIKSVTCNFKNIEEKTLSKELETTPKLAVAGKIVTANSDKATSTAYPENWYKYEVYSGLNGNVQTVFVNVYIYPIKYYKSDSKIEWANEVEVEVEYELPTQTTSMSDDYNFVIITEDEYSSSLQSLASHKTDRGVSTKIVTLSEIYSGTYFTAQGRDDQEQIKYFIKNAVEGWGTSNVMIVGRDVPNREVHVLVGDHDDEIFVSDLYYADIYNGQGDFANWDTNNNDVFAEVYWGDTDDQLDLHPDVHIARIPVNDASELTPIINKIINYENSAAYASNWFGEIIAVGGDSFPGDENSVDEGEYVNEEVLGIMEGFVPTRIWASLGNLATKTSLNSAINSGAGFVDFSGHGNTNVWSTHPHENDRIWIPSGGFVSNDISRLANGEELPIVITGACSVAKYNRDSHSYCYAWLRNPDGGGIASFGATGLGWAYIGEGVTYGLIEKITIETFKAYVNGAITVGEMWTNGINTYLQSPGLGDGGYDHKTILEWQCFGDPTLAVAEESLAPSQPARPDGETSGEINVDYTYTTTATDPDGDEIYLLFDWGDGTYSGWLGPYTSGQTVTATNSWTSEGDYQIKVKAKDIHGVQSVWSDPLSVNMPRNRVIHLPFFEKILERFPNLFPILRNILG